MIWMIQFIITRHPTRQPFYFRCPALPIDLTFIIFFIFRHLCPTPFMPDVLPIIHFVLYLF